MKPTTLSKRATSRKVKARKNISGVIRSATRGSAYAFAATLGIWLPSADAATLVNLDATGLNPVDFPSGLTTWTNTGTTVGDFVSVGTVVPPVVTLDGVNCLGLTNDINTGAALGTSYVGPAIPIAVSTNNPRTVEAWIYDPIDPLTLGTNEVEKTIFGLGRRAAQLNFSLEHGTSTEVGAVIVSGINTAGTVGSIGWNGNANIIANRWTYVAATFDGVSVRVYKDGVCVNSKIVPVGILRTAMLAADNVTPLPFRIGRQNANDATASGGGVGPFYIGRLRVSDSGLTAAQILSNFNADKAAFKQNDTDGDGIPDWWEIRYGLNPNVADSGADGDADGATNLEEYNAGSNPTLADTDGDGINDGTEIHRTNPITTLAEPTNPARADTDGDGLSDAVETGTGTYVSPANTGSNPTKADTDGDGYSDNNEVTLGTDPNNAGATGPAPIISLDATSLALGGLSTWTNLGTMVNSNFTAVQATNLPQVELVDGVKAIHFRTIGGGGANGQHFFGPEMPPELAGAQPRTVDAWVRTDTAQDELTIFAHGRRGGNPATGNNFELNLGQNNTYGAVAMWGGPDIGWNDQEVRGRWTYVAASYDGSTTRVYEDGVLMNSEVITIDTKRFRALVAGTNVDSTVVLHFRVARQNTDTGGIDATGFGDLSIAKVRVFTNALDSGSIKARFDAEKGAFGLLDTDGDGMPDWYEARCGLNPGLNDAAGDLDGDGISNLEEFRLNTRADLADTDGDGVNDNAELTRTDPQTSTFAWTNPLNRDTDNDGLADGVETDTGIFVNPNNTGSDPLKADTDGDSYPDGTEVAQGTNPNDPLSFPDPRPLVNLIATNFPAGVLPAWTNNGTLGGNFLAGNGGGIVLTNQGMRSVTFSGASYYSAYNVPTTGASNLVGNPSYSIEAWVYNPQAADEETVFSWGRRGGAPDGSNCSFNHGLNAGFGAMGHWGAGPDMGWGNATNVVQGRWTYVAYTYNSSSQEQRAYADGNLANSEILGAPLAIASIDSSNVALPFRVASQTDANGPATVNLRGSLAIAELRVYSRVLTPAEITSTFNNGATVYGLRDQDNDGMPSWYERQFPGCLNENSNADAATDCDGDGLNNLTEYLQGTSPVNSDTDGDGISDGNEVNVTGTNPTNKDTDLDGLADGMELALGTSPLNPDSDGDGYSDGIEVLYGSDPTPATGGSIVPDLTTPRPLVDLDATGFALGSLPVWTNNNALGWTFAASTNILAVNIVDGSKGVTFNGTDWYTGPGMPSLLSGDAARTVEAWVWNPTTSGEETVFAWGRRGGPDGSNWGLSYGTDPVFGAIQMWGAFDAPWGASPAAITANVTPGKWTFLAVTYNPTNSPDAFMKSVYKDGVLVYSNTNTGPANTFLRDPSDPNNSLPSPIGRALALRVGAENDAAGAAAVPFATMSIAKIRAYDQALSASQIASHYNAERVQFPGQPVITNVRVNSGNGMILFDWVPAAGHTYRVETNADLLNPSGWAPAATGLNSGSYSNSTAGPANFYRLRIE